MANNVSSVQKTVSKVGALVPAHTGVSRLIVGARRRNRQVLCTVAHQQRRTWLSFTPVLSAHRCS